MAKKQQMSKKLDSGERQKRMDTFYVKFAHAYDQLKANSGGRQFSRRICGVGFYLVGFQKEQIASTGSETLSAVLDAVQVELRDLFEHQREVDLQNVCGRLQVWNEITPHAKLEKLSALLTKTVLKPKAVTLADVLEAIQESIPRIYENLTEWKRVRDVVTGRRSMTSLLALAAVDIDTVMQSDDETQSFVGLIDKGKKNRYGSTVERTGNISKDKREVATNLAVESFLSLSKEVRRACIESLPLEETEGLEELLKQKREAGYRLRIFGEKRPTVARLNRYLKQLHAHDREYREEHGERGTPNEKKSLIVEALNYYKHELNVAFYSVEHTEAVTLTTSKPNRYSRQYLLRQVGGNRAMVLKKADFPEIVAK